MAGIVAKHQHKQDIHVQLAGRQIRQQVYAVARQQHVQTPRARTNKTMAHVKEAEQQKIVIRGPVLIPVDVPYVSKKAGNNYRFIWGKK